MSVTFQHTFGGSGSDWATALREADDGGYIIASYTNSFGLMNHIAWLIKTDENGVE